MITIKLSLAIVQPHNVICGLYVQFVEKVAYLTGHDRNVLLPRFQRWPQMTVFSIKPFDSLICVNLCNLWMPIWVILKSG
jgi:hypothetical protein